MKEVQGLRRFWWGVQYPCYNSLNASPPLTPSHVETAKPNQFWRAFNRNWEICFNRKLFYWQIKNQFCHYLWWRGKRSLFCLVFNGNITSQLSRVREVIEKNESNKQHHIVYVIVIFSFEISILSFYKQFIFSFLINLLLILCNYYMYFFLPFYFWLNGQTERKKFKFLCILHNFLCCWPALHSFHWDNYEESNVYGRLKYF